MPTQTDPEPRRPKTLDGEEPTLRVMRRPVCAYRSRSATAARLVPHAEAHIATGRRGPLEPRMLTIAAPGRSCRADLAACLFVRAPAAPVRAERGDRGRAASTHRCRKRARFVAVAPLESGLAARRVDLLHVVRASNQHHHGYREHSEHVQMLRPYRYPDNCRIRPHHPNSIL